MAVEPVSQAAGLNTFSALSRYLMWIKATGLGARRLVQIQVAYLGFLNQVSLITRGKDMEAISPLEKSKYLGESLRAVLEALEKRFG